MESISEQSVAERSRNVTANHMNLIHSSAARSEQERKQFRSFRRTVGVCCGPGPSYVDHKKRTIFEAAVLRIETEYDSPGNDTKGRIDFLKLPYLIASLQAI